MPNSAADAVGSTTLLFQAPPAQPEDVPEAGAPRRQPSGRSRGSADRDGSLRMLKGARDAAAGMKISDSQIRAVLEEPDEVQPDPSQPHRTRLTRKGVTVTMGNDGMILRVTRRR